MIPTKVRMPRVRLPGKASSHLNDSQTKPREKIIGRYDNGWIIKAFAKSKGHIIPRCAVLVAALVLLGAPFTLFAAEEEHFHDHGG